MKIFFSVGFFVLSTFALAQKQSYKGLPSLVWPKLYDIQFTKATDELGEYDKPLFSENAKALNGNVVTLPGYMMPFKTGIKGTHFMLSSLPLNACFFCGVGGPESVIEVFATSAITFTEKPVEVKGVLRLNDRNQEQMIYLLEDAEFLGEIEF